VVVAAPIGGAEVNEDGPVGEYDGLTLLVLKTPLLAVGAQVPEPDHAVVLPSPDGIVAPPSWRVKLVLVWAELPAPALASTWRFGLTPPVTGPSSSMPTSEEAKQKLAAQIPAVPILAVYPLIFRTTLATVAPPGAPETVIVEGYGLPWMVLPLLPSVCTAAAGPPVQVSVFPDELQAPSATPSDPKKAQAPVTSSARCFPELIILPDEPTAVQLRLRPDADLRHFLPTLAVYHRILSWARAPQVASNHSSERIVLQRDEFGPVFLNVRRLTS
jgi:hypothetical protein